ncbi:class GN sortase [Shewanella avicenniae]|uniref:Class GN sortase n=1 Tax=Shewanella avicenniae TaxID=2814294 RepID=A0ABX7QVK4_9GAMM|nr:class GN sortase [Shewanella avicenniae]QSX35047.1 class GN sortase [Shewanella avicenniae]
MNQARILQLAALTLMMLAATALAKGGYMQAKAMFAQYLIEEAWDKTLKDGAPHKPWFWADTHPIAKLWIGDNEPLYVLAGASGRNLAFGPAQLLSSAPAGEAGNTVIAGHRDTHFAILAYAKKGQLIQLQAMDGALYDYRIRSTMIVHQSQTQWLQDQGEPMLTLLTCYPFNSLTAGAEMRFLVQAEALKMTLLQHSA